MAVILLDPLLLTSFALLIAYVVSVWRGVFRRWYGRAEGWSALAWPLPLTVLMASPVAGAAAALLRLAGIDLGSTGEALTYVVLHVVPIVLLTVWPPRWVLPPWARARLTRFPSSAAADVPEGAVPAVFGRRGHGSRARWRWRVDGLAGFAWVDGEHLRFRAADRTIPASWVAEQEDDGSGLTPLFLDDGRMSLAPPRGGWWHRGDLTIAVGEVDDITPGARRPWARDGLLHVFVEGRRPLHLWVGEIGALVDGIAVLRNDV